MRELGPDVVGVAPVPLGRDRERGEVGVGEHLAVDVARRGIVRDRHPDQPGDLGDETHGHSQATQIVLRLARAEFLVVRAPFEHRVVIPRRQPHSVGVGRVLREDVDVAENVTQVADVVIAAARLGPSRQQRIADGVDIR